MKRSEIRENGLSGKRLGRKYMERECLTCGQLIHESAYSGKDGNFKKHVRSHEDAKNDKKGGCAKPLVRGGIMSKYYQVEINKTAKTSVCPVCNKTNNHIATMNNCNHLHKLTTKGVAFYFWNFRPEGFKA